MAKEKEAKLNILTPKAREELLMLGDSIAKSKKTLALLKELGVGVGDLQAKLEWAEKRRAILLDKG